MNGDQEKKTTEVRNTNEQVGDTNIRRQTVESSKKISTSVILQRIIYYVAGVIVALLVFRIVLLLLAANQGSPFVDFIYGVSGFFAWPFYGVFSYQPAYGQSIFEISSVVAVLVYALVAVGLAKLLTLTSSHDE
ncbi:MAG: Membrane protein involved in colicin uptake [Candidatus Saccharibacteria bacterium]|nr:Membrane protein involved in colicin uptake [Candidatus Saccharibacteria bacterium]